MKPQTSDGVCPVCFEALDANDLAEQGVMVFAPLFSMNSNSDWKLTIDSLVRCPLYRAGIPAKHYIQNMIRKRKLK